MSGTAASARAWEFWRSIGSPKYVVAPMVNQSELAFRLLCRRHGAQLCYTPMFHSKNFSESKVYREKNFTTCAEDRPLFVQFCGDNPATLLAAAKHVEDHCDAVDLNLGCPQGIAKRGHYGAFLLEERQLLVDIVTTLSNGLRIPVTCKVRLLPSIEESIALCKALEAAGCSVLTVHGRTKEQNKDFVGTCNWDAIRRIRDALHIPVIANGGIANMDDVERCLIETGVQGVMTSEAILENPGLFARMPGDPRSQDQLSGEYMQLVREVGAPKAFVRPHLFKLLFTGLQVYTDVRDQLSDSDSIDELDTIVALMAARRAHEYDCPVANRATCQERHSQAVSWYARHQAGIHEEGEPDGDDIKTRLKAFKEKRPTSPSGGAAAAAAATTTAGDDDIPACGNLFDL